jgi:hypothetical protein
MLVVNPNLGELLFDGARVFFQNLTSPGLGNLKINKIGVKVDGLLKGGVGFLPPLTAPSPFTPPPGLAYCYNGLNYAVSFSLNFWLGEGDYFTLIREVVGRLPELFSFILEKLPLSILLKGAEFPYSQSDEKNKNNKKNKKMKLSGLNQVQKQKKGKSKRGRGSEISENRLLEGLAQAICYTASWSYNLAGENIYEKRNILLGGRGEVAGIYIIFCLTSLKCYIGQSSNVWRRLEQHKKEIETISHPNPFLRNEAEKSLAEGRLFKDFFYLVWEVGDIYLDYRNRLREEAFLIKNWPGALYNISGT